MHSGFLCCEAPLKVFFYEPFGTRAESSLMLSGDTKCGFFLTFFSLENKKAHEARSGEQERVFQHGCLIFWQKFVYNDCRVWRGLATILTRNFLIPKSLVEINHQVLGLIHFFFHILRDISRPYRSSFNMLSIFTNKRLHGCTLQCIAGVRSSKSNVQSWIVRLCQSYKVVAGR